MKDLLNRLNMTVFATDDGAGGGGDPPEQGDQGDPGGGDPAGQPKEWTFGEEEPKPEYVTKADLEGLLQRLMPRTQVGDGGEEEDVLEATATKAAQKATAAVTQQFGSLIAGMQADKARESLANKLSAGLGEVGKAFVLDYLGDYDPEGLQRLSGHKKSLDLIRLAAESKAGRGSRSVPRSEETTYGGDDDDDGAEIVEEVWRNRAAYNLPPGTTKAQIRAMYGGK